MKLCCDSRLRRRLSIVVTTVFPRFTKLRKISIIPKVIVVLRNWIYHKKLRTPTEGKRMRADRITTGVPGLIIWGPSEKRTHKTSTFAALHGISGGERSNWFRKLKWAKSNGECFKYFMFRRILLFKTRLLKGNRAVASLATNYKNLALQIKHKTLIEKNGIKKQGTSICFCPSDSTA